MPDVRHGWALGTEGRRALDELMRSRPLVALDFDGTLCPIRARPGHAVMHRRTRALLEQVSRLYPTAIISGRKRSDLVERLRAVHPRYLIGNHGLEPGPQLARAARQVALAKKRLAPAIAGKPGVELEDKRYSLSLHYRRAPQPERARKALVRLAKQWAPGLRLVPGKRVLNLIPPGGDKGRALSELLRRSKRHRALYVGDDDTDEDAFKLPKPKVMSVRVGRAQASAARWYLEGRDEVDGLLAQLISFASRSGP